MALREVQERKPPSSIELKELGNETEERDEQSENVLLAIIVTFTGSVMSFRLEQN